MSLLLFAVSVLFYTFSQKQVFAESDQWKNKYRQPLEPAPVTWYTKLFRLKYKERFPLSGSLLVVITDKYHAFQFGFKVFLCAAIVFYHPLLGYWDALIYFVLWGVIFTVTFRK